MEERPQQLPKAKRSPLSNNNTNSQILRKTQKKKKKQKKNSATCKDEKRAGKLPTSSPECDSVGTPRGTQPQGADPPPGQSGQPDSQSSSPAQPPDHNQSPPQHHLPQDHNPKQSPLKQQGQNSNKPQLTSLRLPVKVAFADRSPVPARRKTQLDNKRQHQQQTTTNRNQQPNQKASSPPAFNESLRWEYQLPDEQEEVERLRVYKMNRRKRYLAAQNELTIGSGSVSSASCSSLSPPTSGGGGSREVTSLPDLMTSQLMTPRSLNDIRLDAVECS